MILMIISRKIFALIALIVCFNLAAQEEPNIAIALLENDDIAEVNVDQESFIGSLTQVTDLAKEEFINIKETQKIAILIIAHPEGEATIEVHSKPRFSEAHNAQIIEKLRTIELENTKLADFPILFLINSEFANYEEDFVDLVSPHKKRREYFTTAGIKEKYELIKEYAVESLVVFGAYETIADEKFVGVTSLGRTVASTDFTKELSTDELTSKNSDYWRATMEMSVGNQIISLTKIFTLISQGQFDHAQKYIEIIRAFSDPETISDRYMAEMIGRLDMFNRELNAKIQEGLALHDKGEYEKALAHYELILKDYPYSAWTKYEVYYSQNALSIEKKEVELADRTQWDAAKVGVYGCNPLYSLDVRANTGKEAYLLQRRASIASLFRSNEDALGDVYKYADIAMDLGVYDFAAQLFWLSSTYDKNQKDALAKYLYCLEKLGVTDIKDIFTLKTDKEFKKIEKNKEKEMTKSEIYNSFNN